jgi:hypothetical protein
MKLKTNHRCWCVFCWLTAGLALCLFAGTASYVGAAEQTAAAANRQIEKNVEKDGVKLTLQLDRDSSGVAEPILLQLRVEAPEGTRVTMPSLPVEIGELRLRQTANLPDVPAGKLRVWTQRYELESLTPGNVELPPMKIAYQLSPGQQSQQLELPAVAMSIASLVGADADPTQFRDIKGAVEILPPSSGFPTWGWIAAGVAALIVVAGVLKVWLRRKPLSADQWAIAELNRINVPLMVEQDRVQELYFLVTAIVRTYIERRFGVHAPKKTTAEFLSEAQQHPLLAGKHQESLGEFLEAADRVKFARWSPDAAQIEATVAGAKWFVETTAESALESTGSGIRENYDRRNKPSEFSRIPLHNEQ